jgi:hypothetical protein
MVSACSTKRSRRGVNSRKNRSSRKNRDRKGSRKNRNSRKGSRKNRNSRKNRDRKNRNSRKNRDRKNRMYYGGMAPIGYTNQGPTNLSLAQGQQFASYHANQHGGSGPYAFGPYPGAVTESSALPQDLVASAHLTPLYKSFDDIKQYGPQSDLTGGGRRSQAFRNMNGGAGFVPWGGRRSASGFRGGAGFVPWGGRRSNSTMKGGRRSYRGGSRQDLSMPMDVEESSKMLIPPQLQEQAGLNPEWKLAENPNSFDPIGK